METLLLKLNGLIRLKVESFRESCSLYNISYIEANYNITKYDPYFSGLIDTDGSIVFNYAGNRIECNLEFKANEFSSKLNFNDTIPYCKPSVLIRKKSAFQNGPKEFSSISYKFQNVSNMPHIYDYFMHNRLYSDLKFYRISKIKPFIEIRKYKNFPIDSPEHKIYANFVLAFIKYENPLYYKIPFVQKYLF